MTQTVIAGVVVGGLILVAGLVAILTRRQVVLRRLRDPFVIAFMGHQASGKSIYLSVMHHEVNVTDRQGFGIRADDPGVEAELHGIYRDLIDPERNLPASTLFDPKDFTHFRFTARTRVAGRERRLGGFTTSDYPGELNDLILDPQAQLGSRGQSHLQQLRAADTVYYLIDGQEILALVNQATARPDVETRFRQRLADVVQAVSGNTGEVHAVVTKWDLVAEAGLSLAKVIKYLITFRDFRNLVDGRPQFRVIPVSSVGRTFFGPMSRTRKLRGGELDPLNVEVPVALAFVEGIRNRLTQDLASSHEAEGSATSMTFVNEVLARTSIQLKLGVVALSFALSDADPLTHLPRAALGRGETVRSVDDAYLFMYERFLWHLRTFDQKNPDAVVRQALRGGAAGDGSEGEGQAEWR